ncbi:MAG: PorV/PorQ family protein [Candidatus Neomarinimicrobiota bacterium]
MRKIFSLILVISAFCGLLSGGANDNAGYAGAFLRMGLGARATAMGNAGVALPVNGFGVYYNPAGLAFLKERHLALTYSFLSLDRQFHFVGISLPLKPTAGVGISWLHAGVKDIQGRTSTGMVDETYETGEDVFLLSFANAFHPKLSFGLNFKILRNQLLDIQATGLGFDVGVLYRPVSWLTAGLQFKDIGASYTWNTQELFEEEGSNYIERFTQFVKFGMALQVMPQLLFSGDVEVSDQNIYQAHFGAEYTHRNLAYLRAGMNNQNPTFGAGLAYGFLANTDTQLDYCLVVGIIGEGATHIFSWQFKF